MFKHESSSKSAISSSLVTTIGKRRRSFVKRYLLESTHLVVLLLIATTNAFTSYTWSNAHRIRHIHLYAKQGPTNLNKGLFEILNDEVSDLILEKLNNKLSNQLDRNKSELKPPRRSEKTAGLSKYYQNMFASTSKRQRCVTGQYPLKLKIQENPTRKWLTTGSSSAGTSQMLVNGTSVDRSLASYERLQWLDNDERSRLRKEHALFSLELLAEINVKKPGYIQILPASSAGFYAKKERERSQIYKNSYKLTFGERLSNDILNKETEGEHGGYSSAREDILERIIESEKERLWITGFSLTKKSGELHYVDIECGSMGYISKSTASAIRWPNEVTIVPAKDKNMFGKRSSQSNSYDEDALLVSDGFLIPGRDNGGLYVISRPGHENEYRSCLAGGNGVDGLLSKLENKSRLDDDQYSSDEDGWFYHRSTWIDLTGDGRLSVLTARAKRPSILNNPGISGEIDDSALASLPTEAQLVWLERPLPYAYDKRTRTPLDKDGLVFDPFSPKHTPWKTRVLQTGPDVMFSVADMDSTDDTIEVFASQFFNKKLTMHSIRRGPKPEVVFSKTIDGSCGACFSCTLVDLDVMGSVEPLRKVLDDGSTVHTLKTGQYFSHLLISSHECSYSDQSDKEIKPLNIGEKTKSKWEANLDEVDGGSIFAYRVPEGKHAWKHETWQRHIVASGFKVKSQLGNIINPGAPGFCYTFFPTKSRLVIADMKGTLSRPFIAVAGDCAESAYIFRPTLNSSMVDPSSSYTLMCEIECGATVGSIGIGYEDFCYAPQQNGYAKIYVPCYEKDKILVFALGNGEDEDDNDGW